MFFWGRWGWMFWGGDVIMPTWRLGSNYDAHFLILLSTPKNSGFISIINEV